MNFKVNTALLKSQFVGIIVMLTSVGWLNPAKAQVASSANYVFSTGSSGNLSLDMNSNPINMAAQPDLAQAAQSSNLATMDLGFDFWFMGTRYFQLTPQVRGAAGLGSLTPYSTTPLPNLNGVAATSAPVLAPLWNQSAFTPASGKTIRSLITGAAPNRCFVVEWNLLAQNNSLSNTADMTFQLRIYERTGVIEYVYGNIQLPQNTFSGSFQAAIGFTALQNLDNTIASVTDLTTYNNTTSVASVNNAVVNQNVGGPISGLSAGRYFRWTPVTPASPTSLTFSNITTTTTTLNWTDNAPNEIGYAIYRSDDGGATYSFIAQVAQNVNTFTQSFLAPSTTYFYRVIAVSEGGNSAALQGSQATIAGAAITTAGAGGNWSAPSTWSGGVVPSANDNVTIADGATVIIDIPNAYCNNLTVGQGTSGILRYSSSAPSVLFSNGNVTVAAGATFDAGTSAIQSHGLVIGGFPANGTAGNLAVNGTFDLNFATSPTSGAGVNVTFGGFANGTISGAGSTCDFFSITVNKGNLPLAWQNPILDVTRPITINAPATAANRLNITSGTFKLSSASTLTPYFGSQTLCAVPGRLWLNNAAASVAQVGYGTLIGAGSPTLLGELRIDNGTLSYGSGNNTMTFNTTTIASITYGARLMMNGGTLNMLGAVTFTGNSAVYFNMTGGNININPQSANVLGTGSAMLTFNSGATINWTGGTVTIVNPHAAAGGTSVSFLGSFGTKNITGGTLQIGDGVSGLASGPVSNTTGYLVSLASPLYNLVINNRTDLSPTRLCRISTTQANIIYNDVTVNANGYLMLSSGGTSATLGLYGNLVNNGTIAGVEPNNVGVLGVVQFYDTTGTQTVSGSGAFTNILQVTLAPALSGFGVQSNNTVVFSQSNPIVVNNFILGAGTLNHNGKLTIGRPSAIPVLQIGGVGVLTAPGSFTSVPNFDNTSFPVQLVYSSSSIAYTLGAYNEIGAGVGTIYNLTVNNTKGLTIGRNLSVVNVLTMTNGNISIGNNNLTLGNGPNSTGTLSYTQGNIICGATGTFTRWFNTTAAPTSAANASQFPVGSSVIGEQRHAWVFFSAATALSTAGTISVRHDNATGLSPMTGYTENSVTMDSRTNSNWNFSTGNGIALGTGTISLAIRGDGALTLPPGGTIGNITLTNGGAAFTGVFAAGTGTAAAPQANRTAIPSFAALTAAPVYLGSPSANIQNVVTAVASGGWNTPATWNGGTIPTNLDNVVIGANVVVTTAGGAACVANNVQIAPGGTLTVDGNTVTFNRNLTLAGSTSTIQTYARLNVSGGTLTVTGDAVTGGLFINAAAIVTVSSGTLNVSTGADCSKQLTLAATSSFLNFTGGRINVYGSVLIQGGVMNQVKDTFAIYPLGPIGGPVTSAASAANHSFQITGSAAPIPSLFTGGVLMIVDPPYLNTFHSVFFNITIGTVSPFSFTGTHTFVIGDGVSTATSPQSNPFRIEQYNGSLNSFIPFNNMVINSGSTPFRHAQTSGSSGAFGTFVRNTLTINSGSEFRQTIDNMFGVGKAIVNNGTLTQMPSGTAQGLHLGFNLFSNLQQIGDVTISGSGVFRNDTLAPTGSFRSVRVVMGSPAYRAIINVNNLSVATIGAVTGLLTMTSGSLDLGTNNFTLGNATAATSATLTYSNGSQILTSAGGSLTRVYPTTGLPTTAATGSLGHYPFGRFNTLNNTVERRDAFVFFSTAGALSTGATIKIAPTHVTGNTTVGAFTDGSVTGVNTRTNTNWNITNTGLVATGTISLKMAGENIGIVPSPTVANTTLMLASGVAAGTYAANSSLISAAIPDFNRTGLSVANISNVTYYGGVASGNNAGGNIFSIANGDWNNAATWSTGAVPTATDNVQIIAPYTVIVSSAAANSCNNLSISTGGTLVANTNTLDVMGQIINGGTILIGGASVNVNNANVPGLGITSQTGSTLTLNGGTLTVGPAGGGAATFTSVASSTLTISSGTFNMNGNMSFASGTFNMSGGALTIDGNSNTLATSVASGTNLVSFTGATQNITGGAITMVDPPSAGTGLAWNQTTGTTWSNTVLRFGDGISTHTSNAAYSVAAPASSQTSGFGVIISSGLPSTIIVNGGAGRPVTVNAGTMLAAVIQINAGSELRTTQNTGLANTISVSGNLINNGTLTTSQNTTLTLNGSSQQNVTGTGVFRVDTTGTIASNINNLTVNNSSATGIVMGVGNLTVGGYSTQSGTLTLTSGPVNMGASTLTLGTSATNTGTLAGATGTAVIVHSTGGGFSRWISATAAPTAVGVTSQFPLGVLVNGTVLRRDFYGFFSTAAITSGGQFTVSHTAVAGTSPVSSFTDGSLANIDTRTNSFWTVTNTGVATTGTVSATAQGSGLLYPLTLASTTLMGSTGALGGTYGAGTNSQTDPRANRTTMSIADITSTPGLYIGTPSANSTGNVFTVASGNWSSASTWSTGTVPSTTDNVTINANHYVTIDAAGQSRDLTVAANGGINANANTLTVNNNLTNNGNINVGGGTLTVIGSATATGITNVGNINLSSGAINTGIAPNYNRTFNTSGSLNITGGTLNINGNMVLGGVFNQGGGSIVVDGNDNTSAGGSVASATHIFQINSTTHNVTGGSITIVDPHFGPTGLAFNYNSSTSVNWTNHTLTFGDGVSATQSGATALVNVTNANLGFGVSTTTATATGRLTLHNVVVNGNGTNRHVAVATSASNSFDVGNNLTINTGSELRTIGAATALAGGLNVGGNITNNGKLVIGSNTTLGFRLNGGTASPYSQTIGGSGQYLNDTTATCSPCFSSVSINNTSLQGVNLSGLSGAMITIDQPLGTLPSVLTFGTTGNYLYLGSKNLTLGGSIAKPGTLSGTFTGNNNLIFTTGTITRWFGTGTITSPAGVFPVGSQSAPVNFNRVMSITAATALTSGGTITVSHNSATSTTAISPSFADGGVTIDKRANSSWTVATANGLTANGATLAMQVQNSGFSAQNLTKVAELRITGANAAAAGTAGTNSGTITDPVVVRSGLDQATIASTFYVGGNSADNPIDNPAIAGNTITAPQTICSGSTPLALTGSTPTGGSGTYSYLWQSSTTSATAGFATATGSGTGQNYTPGALTQSTWYKRIVTSGASADTSAAIKITVTAAIATNTISSSPQTICNGSTPAALNGSTPTGGDGSTYTYRWLKSTTSATAGFSAAGGNDSAQNYTLAAITQSTWYRRMVTSGACANDTTAAVKITVTNAIATNTISSSPQTTCSGVTPTALTASAATGGDGTTYTYAWLSSTTSATAGFAAAAGTNNAQGYSPAALTQSTWFRRAVTSGACASDTTAAVKITVTAAIATNTISSSPQTICSGSTPAALNGSTPTGGDGTTYKFRWVKSTTSATAGFSVAGGNDSAQNYTLAAITQSTWYRRMVTSGACANDTTAAVKITVTNAIATNTISSSPQTTCTGVTPTALTASAATGGDGTTYTYAWLSSTTSATAGFAAAAGTNNAQGYSPAALTQSTWFRRAVTSGACASDTTAAVKITVTTAIATNTISSSPQTICNGSTPTALTASVATGGDGTTYTYAWLSSTTSATAGFAAAAGTNTTQGYSPVALTQTTWFRRRVTSGACNADTTAALQITVSNTNTWTGTTSTAWATITNWGCGRIPVSTDSVVIVAAANQPVIIDGSRIAGSLTIGTGATLALNNSASALSISRVFTLTGSLSHTNGAIIFNGTSTQTIPGATYNNLTVNNSTGVTLGGATTVNGTITLTSGNVSLGNNNLVLAGTTASIAGASASSYIKTNGTGALSIQNIGTGGRTGAVSFPVGNSVYNPATVTNAGTSDAFNVNVIDSVTGSYTGSTPSGAKITTNAVGRTWIINEAVAGGSNATVTVQWNGADELSGFSRAASYVSRYSGTTWLATTASAASGSNPYTQTRSGITSFSPFGVGSSGTLPVKLISFNATKAGRAVQVSWITSSEINNDHFEVQRAADGRTFATIGKVKGKGTTAETSNYTLLDETALEYANRNAINTIYYRLKQVDANGAETFSQLVPVQITEAIASAIIQPNPVVSSADVVLNAEAAGLMKLEIVDMLGRLVISKDVNIEKGSNLVSVAEAAELKGGMYILRMEQNGTSVTIKFTKQD